jgi:chorismate mutase/prephenate dehydratase
MMAGNKDNAAEKDLAAIRERINKIDEQLQALINERAKFAQEVGVAKGDLAQAVDYYRPEREAEILRAVICCGCSGRSCRPVSRNRSR